MGRASEGVGEVVAVVVVHNNAHQLDGCLASLTQAATGCHVSAVVVDAGSSDQPEAVCVRHGVPFVPGPNRGLATAFNRALSREDVRAASYVLQLNPDVRLRAEAVDGLVSVAERHPAAGVVAPRQVDQHGALIYSIGVEPSPAAYWSAVRSLPGDWIWDPAEYERETRADWVMGACMLLRRDLLQAVGGFDERFFLCSEEVDLCRRAREAGWHVLYTPEVTVVHPLADRPLDAHRVQLEEWSRILYMRKWNRLAARASMRLALVTRLILLAALERSHAISPRHAETRLRAALAFDHRRYGPAPQQP